MDTNTSGEELLVTKTRKPYTIRKQRERWTEAEHDRFLEALRLYGRAWQQIEEHIGTKTAVQIRSHAQKFFTKLEKEAEAKGIPVCEALDIEIPPPRPKRKPNTPYPRKPPANNGGASYSQVSSSSKDAKPVSHMNHVFFDLEKMPFSEETSTRKENKDDKCSEVSMNKYPLPKNVTPGNRNSFVESDELALKMASADNETSKASNLGNAVQDVPKKNKDRDGNDITMHSEQNYPWHFRADIGNGNIAKGPQNHPSGMVPQDFMFRPMGEVIQGHKNLQATTSSASTTSHQVFPQNDYSSFPQISSTFSNLIMSTLLQNPAAHAAATFAASVWPYPNSGDSSTQMSSSPPSLAAIAAATVAAATAWWASHGLIPVCSPTPVTCLPLPAVSVPTPALNTVEEKQSTALQDQNLVLKSPASSSGITKLNIDSKTNGDRVEEEIVDAQKKKLVDRSSCGSNTPSGSDLETDALDKMEKDKEEVKETDANQPGSVELSNRRSKTRDNNNNNNNNSSSNNNNNNNTTTDSWKEVSEEGRIAFQALFARERLPQSFSPPQVANNVNEKQSDTSMPLAPPNFNKIQDSSCERQTGFKPYKRCSMEVKESQVGNTSNQSDEKVCKRIRVDGEAST